MDSVLFSTTEGEGEPLVLLHGDPATHTVWRLLSRELAGFRTIHAPDLPGFGMSARAPSSRGCSLHSLAGEIIRWLQSSGVQSFDLVGHSFGGAVAATIAHTLPERVRSLTLIAPLGIRIPPAGRLASIEPLRRVASAIWELAPGSFRRTVARASALASYRSGFDRERADEIAIEVDRPDILETMAGLIAAVDFREYHATLDLLGSARAFPILLIGGSKDLVIPPAHFAELSELLKPELVRVFPDGGHVLQWQYPREVAALIRAHCESCGEV